MNIHLGDLEEYVQEKLTRGGYASASEVVREALRRQRERELEDAIDRRLQAYVLQGVDQGPPEGVSDAEWTRRLTATRHRMQGMVRAGLDELDRGAHVDGTESRTRVMARVRNRGSRGGE